MEIFQIIAIAIMGALLAITIKPYRPEFAVGIGIVAGIVVISMVAGHVAQIFSAFSALIEKSGIDTRYIEAVIKIIGIAYVTHFTCEILKDCEARGLAAKVEFAGKMCVMILTLPIVSKFLELIMETLSGF